MPIDRSGAEKFIWTTARLVDRHRYALLFADGPPGPVIDALRGDRNTDGGFGHGLEPDLRGPASQPAPTLYALEILNEAGAGDHNLARDARAWIGSIAEPDGGIPLVLPGFESYPHPPWLADTAAGSEPGVFPHIRARRRRPPGRSDRRRLARSGTKWSWHSIESTDKPDGYWLKYALAFLDAVPDQERAEKTVNSLAQRVNASIIAPVVVWKEKPSVPSTSRPAPAAHLAHSSTTPTSKFD